MIIIETLRATRRASGSQGPRWVACDGVRFGQGVSLRVTLAGWLVGRLAGWLAGWLTGCLAGRLAVWLAGRLARWLAGCLAGWPAG